ncbi:MAG: hypothetical protein HYU36_15545 [Planctomycetes bacterium]|nr:hypothetical protein [Planctomycetota bacterium]
MTATAKRSSTFSLLDFCVIDLETTGLDAERDEIIEFGAVRVRGGKLVESFSELADPGRPIPAGVSHLTGIRDSDVRGRPCSRDVLQRFLSFLADEAIVVAHHASFEASFLKARGAAAGLGRLFDTLVLARILWPEMPHHDLQSLGQVLALSPKNAHRAAADAETTVQVWLAILRAARELPPAVIETLARLFRSDAESPCAAFFGRVEAESAHEASTRRDPSYGALFHDFSEYLSRLKPEAAKADEEEEEEEKAIKPLNVEKMAKLFSQGSVFVQRLPEFEYRPEQGEMVRAICTALNEGDHALIEAGTGTGKSLAYLTPVVGWSLLNDTAVIISTNTRSLQDQLFQKDIPALRQALDRPFHAVRLKGASNYLCVRRFLQALEHPDRPFSPEEQQALAALVVWASRTESGDISECSGFFNLKGMELWERLGLGGKECMGSACRQGRRCFLFKAKGEAAGADVVVVNHALVFSEIGLSSALLPPASCLVFDEAHNLENVATESLTRRITRYRLTALLGRLHPEEGSKGPRGLLSHWLGQVRGRARPTRPPPQPELPALLENASDRVRDVRERGQRFFQAGVGLFAAAPRPGRSRLHLTSPPERLRYTSDTQEGPAWSRVLQEGQPLMQALRDLAQALIDLQPRLAEALGQASGRPPSSLEELSWRAGELTEYASDLESILQANSDQTVYWASREKSGTNVEAAFQSAPIDVGSILLVHLFQPRPSVVLVSATLTVAQRFDSFKQRVGLDRLGDRRVLELSLPSCFDHENQALLAIPSFLPAPEYDQQDFSDRLADLLVDLFRISRGRGLVLCTSYSMLEALHARLKPALADQAILVLGQGIDGETGQIARIFKSDGHAVLLGTQSFWEGFDAPGDCLRVVVVSKLPFPVHTDPVIEARCQLLESRGVNSFMHYVVPSAAIRLKQGFGRLLRRKTDFGVVVLSDKRVLTKRYGPILLQSLPAPHQEYARREDFLRDVQAFLEEKDERSSGT